MCIYEILVAKLDILFENKEDFILFFSCLMFFFSFLCVECKNHRKFAAKSHHCKQIIKKYATHTIMRKQIFVCLGLCTLALFTACKSQESAYKAAYDAAKANEATDVVVIAPQETKVETPVPTTTVKVEEPVVEDNTPVRTIQGGLSVIKGEPLLAYSVVVGSFMNQTNAEGLYSALVGQGYNARVVRTNETINGHTGWYRVAASSYDQKSQAASSRNVLQNSYPGAWLLFNK